MIQCPPELTHLGKQAWTQKLAGQDEEESARVPFLGIKIEIECVHGDIQRRRMEKWKRVHDGRNEGERKQPTLKHH